MMGKNKILVGCLSLLLVLSVGYALFSDNITINGTATAKGSFDITATCETGISSKLGTAETLGLSAEGGYEKDSCSVTDDNVSINVGLLYPGATRHFTVKLTNTGTIDAVSNLNETTRTITFCYTVNPEIEDVTDVNCLTSTGNNTSGIIGLGYSAYVRRYFYAISDENDNILSNDEIGAYYDLENNIVTLPPGYSGYLVLQYMIDADNSSGVLNAKITSTLEFPFEQATN